MKQDASAVSGVPATLTVNGAPFTREEIAQALRALHAESVAYWTSFPTPAFLAPIGDAWSPAENVRHLTKSMRAVTTGLRMPRLLLRLKFGKAPTPSRSFEVMRSDYRKALVPGVTAGRFTPSARTPALDGEAERARIMRAHEAAVQEMCAVMQRWPEAALDRLRLPHPLLGRLTVREMLLFTLYHNQHHVDGVRARMVPGPDA